MPATIDLTGQTFGALTVIEQCERKKKATLWRCRCSCGKEAIVQASNLRSGHSKSCGKCNTIIPRDGYMECRVKNGRSFLFDEEDLPVILRRTWTVGRDGYVHGTEGDKTVKLHRLIMNAPDEMVVDHINGDPSDCRKANMRIVTQHQNSMNHGPNRNSSTGYKGVCFDKREQKYMAHIHPNRRMVFLGYYDDPIDAAHAYDRAASFYFGQYARPNFA